MPLRKIREELGSDASDEDLIISLFNQTAPMHKETEEQMRKRAQDLVDLLGGSFAQSDYLIEVLNLNCVRPKADA